jgi:hypothetical protein
MPPSRSRPTPPSTTGPAASPRKRGAPHGPIDTVVERITGRPADVPVPVAVNLVVTDETLLGGD